MTFERCYIAEIATSQEKVRSLLEQAEREPNKQIAMHLLDLAEEALERSNELRLRANQYLH